MESLPPKPPGPPELPAEQVTEEVAQSPSALPAEEPAPEGHTEGPAVAAEDASAAAAHGAQERRRPRGRTTLIIACAALLGVVAGVATGYTFQADRKPTPLPPLSGPPLSYPKERLSKEEYEPVPAKYDHRVKTDGDLRKLLVEKPKGARVSTFYPGDAAITPVGSYARQFVSPGVTFEFLLSQDIRRVAEVGWESGENKLTVVTLAQFRERDRLDRGAVAHARGQQEYMSLDDVPRQGIEGSGNGLYYVYDSPAREPGYLPLYEARAIAYRGDIMMDIQISDTEPISENAIRKLAEKQWERL